MKIIPVILNLLLVMLLVSSCSSVKIQDYAQENPQFNLEHYFNGDLTAHGFFQDRSGKVIKRFTVKMKGTWVQNKGVLEEDFSYSDGTKSRRVWNIEKKSESKYIGQADDVIGEAQGETAGNAFHWSYDLNLPVEKTTYQVHFDDWMYLMDDKIMLNKSVMSKFGFNLGEVVITFTRNSP